MKDALPRVLAPGVTWLGECLVLPYHDSLLHSHHSLYLISGESESLLVDTGHPKDWDTVNRQLDRLLAGGAPPIRYLFPTHAEVPHSANLGRLLTKFPEAQVYGDVRDYHLAFPGCEARLNPMQVGDSIDLGTTRFVFREAVVRDLVTSVWGYDVRSRTLFPGDGFGYMHHHAAGECGKLAEEIPGLPVQDLTALFTKIGLYWTHFTDMEPVIAQIDRMLASDEYPVDIVAAAHSSPIGDPEITVPKVKAGFRQVGGSRLRGAEERV
jgi:Metallo-beta-lactamase superfamily